MKKIFTLLLFLLLMGFSTGVFASSIPDKELEILKKTFPTLNVRFDGLVELSDGTNYIPVYPVQPAEVSDVKIVKTIPAKTLKDKPDFIMFNTDFALFKIVSQKGQSTIIYNNDIPENIKMGILPQDLLVPPGFQIPEQLKIIIGNLVIPVIPSTNSSEKSVLTGQVTHVAPKVKLVEQTAQHLAHKYLYTTSFNKNILYVLNADSGRAFKEIEFSSIPSDMKLTNDGKYLLVSTLRDGIVFVIDTHKTKVIKELIAGQKPSFIAVSALNNLAYVANRAENAISVIDLKTMKTLDAIKVTGKPSYIELSADKNEMYYLDSVSGVVYSLTKKDDYYKPYVDKPLFRTNNISKIQFVEDKIFTLDRGKNTIDVFYLNGKPETTAVVQVADITPVAENSTVQDNEKVAVNDYNYYNDKKDEDVPFAKEKTTFKQKTVKVWRKLLYYPEDDKKEQPVNVNNITRVYSDSDIKTDEPSIKANSDKVLTDEEVIEKDLAQAQPVKKQKTLTEYWQGFMNYKAVEDPKSEIEIIKTAVDKQMDFISIKNRANDFIVENNKIYALCSDDYALLAYDIKTQKLLATIELDKKGYYNSIKISNDKKVGAITNISSKEIILFDTAEDKVIQKLPLSVNVHNVVISGK